MDNVLELFCWEYLVFICCYEHCLEDCIRCGRDASSCHIKRSMLEKIMGIGVNV